MFCRDRDAYDLGKFYAKIRRRGQKRDNKTCTCCGGPGSTVHHRSHDEDVIRGENDEKLATVCDGCNYNIHHRADDKKRPEGEWDAVLLAGQNHTGLPQPVVEWKRKRAVATYPADWAGMTALQRAGWDARRRELEATLYKAAAQRRGKRLASELAKQGPNRGFVCAPDLNFGAKHQPPGSVPSLPKPPAEAAA